MQAGGSQSKKRHRPHVPLEKRKRAVKACTRCRITKRQCRPGPQGQCMSCARSRQPCVYEDDDTAKEQEARSRESLDGGDRSVSQPSSISWANIARDVSTRFNDMCPENSLGPSQFSILSRLFREALTQSSPPPNLTDHTFDVESPLSRVDVKAVADGTLASQNSFLAAVSEAISPEEIPHDKTSPQIDEDLSHASIFGFDDDSKFLRGVLAKLPPYPEARFLTDIFFTYLESNWYYFDERWFRDLLRKTYPGFSRASHPQCTTVCLIFLVLALGDSFRHLHPSAATHSAETDVRPGELPGSRFYAIAARLMPSVLTTLCLESVQCCILTGLYTLPLQSATHHYTYMGLALRLAVSMSLHLNKTDGRITPQAREVRARVFWTAYCLERRMSVTMGLPITLQTSNITVSLPQRRQDLDELRPQKVDRLIAFTKLNLQLDKITQASPLDEDPDKCAWACSVLDEWKQSLPLHLMALDDTCLRASAHLDIMYQMIWIYIGRGSLLRLACGRPHQPSGARRPELPASSVSCKLSERCTDAAYAIIEWIDLLRNRNRLAKFSHTDFHSCSSAIIALLLKEVIDPHNRYSSSIERGIEALHFMASGSQLAKDALHLVERLQAGVQKLVQRNERRSQKQPGPISQDCYSLVPDSQSAQVDGALEYTASDFEAFDPLILSDLEPSLLQYSDPDLALFGFDGFCPPLETYDFM